jgi:anthranilate/para-aminobenzoate synthase component II
MILTLSYCSKNPRGILISPGPGRLFSDKNLVAVQASEYNSCFHICSLGEPRDSGISLQTVLELGPTIPIFGVCMGLQCIGEAFGG